MEGTRYTKNYRKEDKCNMNFHDDKWIMDKLQEHLDFAYNYIEPSLILGIFLRGSQNYLLDEENSDVDSVLLVVPSIDDICIGRQMKSTTLIMPNDEHIDVKDIRWFRGQILKQSPQFMECLMTPYYLIKPSFYESWNILLNHKGMYFNYDKKKMIKAMRGYAHEKHHALTHEYPSRMHMIKKYGYDPKQLMHLARYKELVKNFALGVPFPDVLICKDQQVENYLRELKSGKFDLAAAQRIAEQTLKTADDYANMFIEHEPDPDSKYQEMVESYLDQDIGRIIKESLKQQFEKENQE